jgi:hypothetical protein
MRTTLDIPGPLIEEARKTLGFKSKSDTVVFALCEILRRGRLDDLKRLFGSVDLQIDLPRPRRRPARRT